MTLRLAILCRNAEADATATLLAGGSVSFYSGAQPATPETAASGTLLGTQTLANPAFAAAVGGVADANPAPDGMVIAAGTVGWARFRTAGGDAVLDCSAGTTGDAVTNADDFAAGQGIALQSLSYARPMQ